MNRTPGSSAERAVAYDVLRSLMNDLAQLAQAQAGLAAHLSQLLTLIREDGPGSMVDVRREAADNNSQEPGSAEAFHVGAPAVPPAAASAESPTGSSGDGGGGTVDDPDSGWAQSSAVESVEIAEEDPNPADGDADFVIDEALDQPEVDSRELKDLTVLVLESGNAQVGVFWDQVIQVGTLAGPHVPERLESEHGPTDLVSLGLLLHGRSLEERYFVVLESEGERAAIACERMLGLGPLHSAPKSRKDAPIQVLRVPLLRTFAQGPRPGMGTAGDRSPESGVRSRNPGMDRDRVGPLRALVAVRYLPARVAICRQLRARGWQVGEAAGLEAATVSLDLGRWDALFLEARSNEELEETESTLLRCVHERSIPLVRVGSRVTGLPGGGGPAVTFPFVEAELDSILERVGAHTPA